MKSPIILRRGLRFLSTVVAQAAMPAAWQMEEGQPAGTAAVPVATDTRMDIPAVEEAAELPISPPAIWA